GEHARVLAAHQAGDGEAGDALDGTVVGHRAAVGGDGRGRLVDGQGAVNVVDIVVAGAQARGTDGVVAGVASGGCVAAVDEAAAEHRLILAADEAAVSDGKTVVVDRAIVYRAHVICGNSQGGRVDDQGAVNEGQLVVAVSATGGVGITAGVGA